MFRSILPLRHAASASASASSHRVLISGAGIGGVTAALALARARISGVLYESAAEFKPKGAGLVITPNGMKALDRLGVGSAVRSRGARIERVTFATLDAHKRVLNSHSFVKYEQKFGAPSIGITRARLHQTLLEALQRHATTDPTAATTAVAPATTTANAASAASKVAWPIELGTRILDYDSSAGGITLTTDRATSAAAHPRGTVLIGADGLHSAVRRAMLRKLNQLSASNGSSSLAEPEYAGWSLWTGVSSLGSTHTATHVHGTDRGGSGGGVTVLDGQILNMIGDRDGRVFLLIDMGGGMQYWGLATRRPLNASRSTADELSPSALLETLRATWTPALHPLVLDTIAATAPADLLFLPIFDRTAPCAWTDVHPSAGTGGRVMLLGDAVHPTQPTGGQGAGMAIEDAEAVAHAIARYDFGSAADTSAAAREYTRLRAARCAQIVLWSHRIGAVYTSTSPLVRRVRDLLIGYIPEALAMQRMSGIYGYVPPFAVGGAGDSEP